MSDSNQAGDPVEIDYSRYDAQTQKLEPAVYRQGDVFAALSGPDRETGIYGEGDTPDAAIKAWRSALQERFDKLHGDELKP
jgi:hypothetical protein